MSVSLTTGQTFCLDQMTGTTTFWKSGLGMFHKAGTHTQIYRLETVNRAFVKKSYNNICRISTQTQQSAPLMNAAVKYTQKF